MTTIYVSRGQYSGYEVIAKVGGVYDVDANIDMNANDITDLDDITFTNAGQALNSDTAGLHFTLPSGDVLDLTINSVLEYAFSSTTLDVKGNDIIGWDDLIGVITTREIRNNASSMQMIMESGGVLDVIINSVTEYTFAASTLDLGGNILSEVALIQGLTTTNQLDDTTSGWIINGPTSCRISIGSVNQVQIADGTISFEDCYVDMTEQTAPSAPAANTARLYVDDNGAGKTRLNVRFNTGAVQVIATQP